MDSIGSRLAQARVLRGFLTQDALAKAANVSQSTIGNIEAGIRNGLQTLPALAKTMRVRHEWLRDGEEPMEPQVAPWPFPGIDPARVFRLTPEQRLELQGAVRTMLAEFERGEDSGPAPLQPPPGRPRPDIRRHR